MLLVAAIMARMAAQELCDQPTGSRIQLCSCRTSLNARAISVASSIGYAVSSEVANIFLLPCHLKPHSSWTWVSRTPGQHLLIREKRGCVWANAVHLVFLTRKRKPYGQ